MRRQAGHPPIIPASPLNLDMVGRRLSGGPLLTNLVAYWNMDETSGQRVDSHSNGFNLTDNNTCGNRTGVGAAGTAADFIAANSEYLSGILTGSMAAPWELAMWLISDSDPGAAACSFDAIDNDVGTGGFRVEMNTAGRFFLSWRDSTLTLRSTAAVPGTDVTGIGWCFVRAWHDGTNGHISINNGTAQSATFDCAALPASKPIRVFSKSSASPTFLDGGAQATGLWSRNLTADERTWLYNSGTAVRLYADVAAYTG